MKPSTLIGATLAAAALPALYLRRVVRRYRSPSNSSPLTPFELLLLTRLNRPRPFANQLQLLEERQARVDRLDFRGFVLGAAVGDAFGAGVEMLSAEWIASHVDFTRYVDARTGKYGVAYGPGYYTDDTEHTLANIHALLQHRILTRGRLLKAYREEYERSRNYLGIGRNGHGGISEYLENPTRGSLKAIRARQVAKVSPGNAPAMRAAVFGFSADIPSMVRNSVLNADVTHPHPTARASSLAIAFATRHLALERKSPHDLIRETMGFLGQHQGASPMLPYLQAVDALPDFHQLEPDREVLLGGEWGLPCDSLYTTGACLYLLKHARSSLELLKRAVRLGGDVDSAASICLSIFGATGQLALGRPDGIPGWMVDQLENVAYLAQMGDRLERWYDSSRPPAG